MRQMLAVDIGGTHVKWGVVSGGAVAERGRLDTPRGGAHALSGMLVELHERVAGRRELPLGVAVAGWVDPATHVVRRMSALGIEDWDVAADLRAAAPRYARPMLVVNDLVAACAGEAEGRETLLVLAFGTGVAAKMAVDGLPVTGAAGLAGELGHQTFSVGGRRCGCGRSGCVEAYAGWGGLQRAMRRRALTGGPAELASRAARDPRAGRLIDQALEAAGFAAAIAVCALDPGVVRVGGGLHGAWGDRLVAAVRDGIRRRCWQGHLTRVEPARHGQDAPLIGIARLTEGTPRP